MLTALGSLSWPRGIIGTSVPFSAVKSRYMEIGLNYSGLISQMPNSKMIRFLRHIFIEAEFQLGLADHCYSPTVGREI